MGDTYVYMHKNKLNGKIYIGITKNIYHRWRGSGLGYRNNEHFYRAIMKYGWSNFEHTVLFENLSREEACLKEKELIDIFSTQT